VAFSEPLSFLQRLTEDLEYSDLLDAVAGNKEIDRCLQLCYVAAFMVSAYADTGERIYRPFNPLLGETYECDRTSDLGWRSFAEKVGLFALQIILFLAVTPFTSDSIHQAHDFFDACEKIVSDAAAAAATAAVTTSHSGSVGHKYQTLGIPYIFV
jgi:hypothetical protein